MTYIAEAPMKGGSAASEQPFTDIPTLSDEDGLVVARGELVYVVLNLYPYNPGHSMVVPYRRVSELEDLTAEESAELMAFTQKAIRVIKSVSRPHGFNVGLNLGTVRRRVAGRAPAHARGAALERRRELHHDHRRLQDHPAAAARDPPTAGRPSGRSSREQLLPDDPRGLRKAVPAGREGGAAGGLHPRQHHHHRHRRDGASRR